MCGSGSGGKIFGVLVLKSRLVDILDASSAFFHPGPLVAPFPYTRLASTAPVNSALLYLYHQINDTTIAEDQYGASIGHWISN